MPVHRIGRTELRQVEAQLWHAHLEDVQHLERRHALPRRRELEHVVAVIVRRDRLDPFGLELREVLSAHDAAIGLDLLHDRLGDLATVEHVFPVLLDQPQRLREAGIPDDAVERGRGVAGEKRLPRIWIREQAFHRAAQIVMPPLGETPAFFGDTGGRLEGFLEAPAPEFLQQRVIAGNRAGDGRGIDAAVGHALDAKTVGEELRRPPGGRPTRRGERVELLVASRPDQREQIAADPGVVLRGDVEHRARRHGRVDRVPAAPHDLEAGLRRQRIARRHDPVPREHLGSPLRQPALRAGSRHGWNRGGRHRLVCGGNAEWRRRLGGKTEHSGKADGDQDGNTHARHLVLFFHWRRGPTPAANLR